MRKYKWYLIIILYGLGLCTVGYGADSGPGISNEKLPDGIQFEDYEATLTAIGVEGQSLHWKITAKDLPLGMRLNSRTGKISGRAKLGGVYLFTAQLCGPRENVLAQRDFTIKIHVRMHPAADFDYDGDVDYADKCTFFSSYTGPRPRRPPVELSVIAPTGVVLKVIEDVWLREIAPDRTYENDGVSVYSIDELYKDRRTGMITFDLSELKGKQCRGAVLELYNISAWGAYRFPINQTASIVTGRASGSTLNSYLANQQPHEQLLEGLRHKLVGSEKGGTYIASTPAYKPEDISKIQAVIDGDGILTLILKQIEDGIEYKADWGDLSRIKNPARLRIFIDSLPCFITTTVLPKSKINVPYSTRLSVSQTCSDSTQLEITDGYLPDGLRLNRTSGLISGKPRFGGTYPFRVKMHDRKNNITQEVDLTIMVETPRADFDKDGDVDDNDLSILEESFTGALEPKELSSDWRKYVTKCLDTLIEHGRDVYGPVKTMMLMAVIDVRTLEAPEKPDLYDNYIRTEGRPNHGRRSPGGSNLWLDMPTVRTMYCLSKITGDKKYSQAADHYIDAAFKSAINSEGMLYWGSHSYYHAYRDAPGGDGLHEILILHPAWEQMYRVDPEATRREVDAIWEWHIIDPKTGSNNRHNDKGRTGVGSFGFSSGSFAIAFSFMYSVTNEQHYLEKAKKVLDWHLSHRNPETNLISDSHGPWHPAGASGAHASQMIRCYEMTGDEYFLDAATTYIKAYDKYGWDEQAGTYWGMLELDGTHLPEQAPGFTLDDPAGYWYPTGHVNVWRTSMYAYELPLIAAQASIYAYEQSGDNESGRDPELLKIALHWSEVIEKDLPPHPGRRWRTMLEKVLPDVLKTNGTYAENYGRAISFFVHLYRATKYGKHLHIAQTLAKEAVDKLYENSLFKGHPAKPYYEANDGVGLLLYALLELDRPMEAMAGAF